jgi:hypothetical protein
MARPVVWVIDQQLLVVAPLQFGTVEWSAVRQYQSGLFFRQMILQVIMNFNHLWICWQGDQ